MSAAELLFNLFTLLLGFILVEVLSGLMRTLRARLPTGPGVKDDIRIGWLTPMLGVYTMLNVLMCWVTLWEFLDYIPIGYDTLTLGLLLSSFYYFAASMIYPDGSLLIDPAAPLPRGMSGSAPALPTSGTACKNGPSAFGQPQLLPKDGPSASKSVAISAAAISSPDCPTPKPHRPLPWPAGSGIDDFRAPDGVRNSKRKRAGRSGVAEVTFPPFVHLDINFRERHGRSVTPSSRPFRFRAIADC